MADAEEPRLLTELPRILNDLPLDVPVETYAQWINAQVFPQLTTPETWYGNAQSLRGLRVGTRGGRVGFVGGLDVMGLRLFNPCLRPHTN